MAWPSASLTTLKRSRSMNSTATPAAFGATAAESHVDALVEQEPVGQVGEGVVEGLVLERGLEPVALDGDGRQVHGPLHQIEVRLAQLGRHPVEEGQRAQQLARARGDAAPTSRDWLKPSSGEQLGRRTQPLVVHQVVDEQLAPAAAQRQPGPLVGWHGVEQGHQLGNRRQPGAHPDHPVVVEQTDGRAHVAQLPLQHAHDLLQGDLQGRTLGDGLEQVGLLAQQVLGPAAGAHVAQVDHVAVDGGIGAPVGHPQAHHPPGPVPVRHPELVAAAPPADRSSVEHAGAAAGVVGVQEVDEGPLHELA